MSHYQLSFTTRQATAFFVVALAALAACFFFGLMTGLSGRPHAAPEGPASEAAEIGPTPSPARTAAGTPPRAASLDAGEPTPPASIQAFEDAGGEESAPAARNQPTRVPVAAPRPGGVWIQVASLASRAEADALLARLSSLGFPGIVSPVSAPRGRVFRVRVGPFRSETEASRMSARVRQGAKVGQVWIVKDGR